MRGFGIGMMIGLISLSDAVYGQHDHDCGVVIGNRAEDRVMSDVEVRVSGMQLSLRTDAVGRLDLTGISLPVTLDIHALTCKRTVVAQQCGDTVWVECPDIYLPTAEYIYLDAHAIVAKAVANIPANYPDSGFVLYGFFRNYKDINHRFREFTEARVFSAMRVEQEQQKLRCREAFGVQALRRTPYTIEITAFYDHALEDLFKQNMIYHPDLFPISGLYIDHTTFIMDSAATTDTTWTIRYAMHRVTGENHGVDNYVPEHYAGDAKETGYFIIHREHFAFLKIVRESVRNPKYGYPGHNNFLKPDLIYTGEFIEGYLEVDYAPTSIGYIPGHIFHAHTNTFTHVATNTQTYRVTDYNEWFSDSISMVVSSKDHPLLLSYRNDLLIPYTYDPSLWTATPKWVFVRSESVWEDLWLRDDPEKQFIAGGR